MVWFRRKIQRRSGRLKIGSDGFWRGWVRTQILHALNVVEAELDAKCLEHRQVPQRIQHPGSIFFKSRDRESIPKRECRQTSFVQDLPKHRGKNRELIYGPPCTVLFRKVNIIAALHRKEQKHRDTAGCRTATVSIYCKRGHHGASVTQ